VSAAFRFPIRVKPNARREIVGGVWPGPNGDALVVAVAAPAVDGKANDAVRKAVAAAFGVRRQQVSIVAGERSRDKLIELDPAPDRAAERLAALLAG
jgi:uncharacterized protein (TIGR00251 family)